MTKNIYIIRNEINNKVYIGQTVNIKHRWEQYISDYNSSRKSDQMIVHAMKKYGIEKFHIAVLEENVENYDEREIYWIKFFNSLAPNGYNVCIGGQGVGSGVEHPNASLTLEQLSEIKTRIMLSTDSFNKIARDMKCTPSLISSINNGTSYFDKNASYPLRWSRKRREIIKQVIYALKYEHNKSIYEISKEYEIDVSTIHDINNGTLHFIKNETYPLRKGRVFSHIKDIASNIIKDLIETDFQQKDIAKKYNVSINIVSQINRGTSYRQDNIQYPIRNNYQAKNGGRNKKCLSPNEIKEIEYLLKNTNIGIRKIAGKFEVCYETIAQINLGAIVKYRQENSNYPIRKIYTSHK